MATVLVEDTGGVRTITLNRPKRRNALVPEMQEELIVAFRDAAAAGARVIVLRAEGEAFCSGLDLTSLEKMKDHTAEQHRVEADRVARMFRAVWDCDVPSIAAVHRAAIAGGTGLALLCDFTIAAPEAFFGFTEARIGFVPALVGAYLALQVGDKVARGLLLSAKRFDAEEALRLGLVNEIVPAEELQDRVVAFAGELMRNSPESLRVTKRLLRAQQAEWLDGALELAIEANAASRLTADFREGITAFLEKREPVWKK
jgi:methylglutaconyl-CoA hydratase